jgi:hypothetical protein
MCETVNACPQQKIWAVLKRFTGEKTLGSRTAWNGWEKTIMIWQYNGNLMGTYIYNIYI